MLFCSRQFLYFFAVVFTVYWALPWRQARVGVLLAASFYFYASWNRWLALIVCGSTLLDYLVARGLDASSSMRFRRLLLSVSLVANLGLLVYFKYANFFLRSVEDALRAAGSTASLPVLQVILPIGLSFYTFEAINYTVDVYRRRVTAERNLLHFMLFILFFPHLVAGPIVRAATSCPRSGGRSAGTPLACNWGRNTSSWDCSRNWRSPTAWHSMPTRSSPTRSATVAERSGWRCWPTRSRFIATFPATRTWRWGRHTCWVTSCARTSTCPISRRMSRNFGGAGTSRYRVWLRDYLFIPLGGSRGTRRQTERNLLITMTLGGLWHGASWTFVIWGMLHGGLLIVHRRFRGVCEQRPRLDSLLQTWPGRALATGVTFLSVCVGWVFFRATSFPLAATLLHRLAVPHRGISAPCARSASG